MTFYEWLTKQVGRDDPVGDLAGDVMRDKECPRTSSELGKWDNYLRFRRASPEAIDALWEAFAEYEEFQRRVVRRMDNEKGRKANERHKRGDPGSDGT